MYAPSHTDEGEEKMNVFNKNWQVMENPLNSLCTTAEVSMLQLYQ
jgi:hypothetical protein